MEKALDMCYTRLVTSVRFLRPESCVPVPRRAPPAMKRDESGSPPQGWKCSGKDARVKVTRSELTDSIMRSLSEASKALQEPKKRDRILVGTSPW